MVSDGAARLIIAAAVIVLLVIVYMAAAGRLRSLFDALRPGNWGNLLTGGARGAGRLLRRGVNDVIDAAPDVVKHVADALPEVAAAATNAAANTAVATAKAAGRLAEATGVADAGRTVGDAFERAEGNMNFRGATRSCPAGMEMQNGLCYTPCSPGFVGEGPICRRRCPPGMRNDGLYCAKGANRTLPAGIVPGRAPCPRGWTTFPLTCTSRSLPLRTRTRAARCPERAPRLVAGLCYRRCPDGFVNHGPLVCSPRCPPGMTDIGVSCRRDAYGRGAGRIPDINPAERTL